MSPTISVVMSVYNGAEHLAETLDSILAQTERDFELIVVDDGSTDETPAILRTYAERDSRMRVHRQENRGLTRALIAGCAAAEGTYIARQDVGDRSDPERLKTQRAMLDQSTEVGFVSCATQYVGPALEPLWIAKSTGAALSPTQVLDNRLPHGLLDGPTHHGSVMFRRDMYDRAGGYRAPFYYGQDFDLWYRLAALGKFASTDAVLYMARIEPGGISGVARKTQQRFARLSRAALAARLRGQPEDALLAEAASIPPATSKGSTAAGLYFIGEALRRNGDARAAHYFKRAVTEQPFAVRAWIRWLQSVV